MNRAIRTKGCKRCGGDLSWEQDRYGTYLSCIQCGAEYQPQSLGISAYGKVGWASNTGQDDVMGSQLAGAGSK
jgi:hypothetical protein